MSLLLSDQVIGDDVVFDAYVPTTKLARTTVTRKIIHLQNSAEDAQVKLRMCVFEDMLQTVKDVQAGGTYKFSNVKCVKDNRTDELTFKILKSSTVTCISEPAPPKDLKTCIDEAGGNTERTISSFYAVVVSTPSSHVTQNNKDSIKFEMADPSGSAKITCFGDAVHSGKTLNMGDVVLVSQSKVNNYGGIFIFDMFEVTENSVLQEWWKSISRPRSFKECADMVASGEEMPKFVFAKAMLLGEASGEKKLGMQQKKQSFLAMDESHTTMLVDVFDRALDELPSSFEPLLIKGQLTKGGRFHVYSPQDFQKLKDGFDMDDLHTVQEQYGQEGIDKFMTDCVNATPTVADGL